MKKARGRWIAVLMACALAIQLTSCNPKEQAVDSSMRASAKVTGIEKYGHAVLDLTTADLVAVGYRLGDVVCVRLKTGEYTMPFYDGYYSNPKSPLLRGTSSEDYIALCINYGDFSAQHGVTVGDTAEITMVEKAGMLAIQELYSLQYSKHREDYSDDASFSNFRAVTAGRMGEGKLYRGSSPINNENNRADYAGDFIESARVATVLNLADSAEDVVGYMEKGDSDCSYYRSLYESGKVMAVDLTGNFYSEEFSSSLAKGLSFLARNQAPYYIHCTEGKDRTGFTAMLLEALMGATTDEMIDDYMLSFYNYYGIDKETEPERYEAVLNINLLEMLYHITGVHTYEELEKADLEAAATNYLLAAGMSERDILALKENLR